MLSTLAFGVVLPGCPPEGGATLIIVDPVDGAVLTLATDTRPDLEGVQATVLVEARRVAVGTPVYLLLDSRTIIGTEYVPASGDLVYLDVTLPSGERTLTAVTDAGDVRSNEVRVSVDDGCASIDFVTPAPSGDSVTLGPSDDTDGEACGGSFETTVVVATDAGSGADARVFVNGTPRVSGSVVGSTARFDGVGFDLGATPNELMVEVITLEGVTCRQTFPSPIYVDCAGVLCRITQPATTSAFLNQSDDVSDAVGFQGDFDVTTDADGAGQVVRLIVDGDESGALSATPTATATGGVASFGNVGLSEGVHRIQALCSDEAGNRTRTTAEWTIDISPCDISIASPVEGALLNDTDDLDLATDGIQIAMSGFVGGGACTALRVGHCDALPEFQAFSDAAFTEELTLSSSSTQRLCAEIQDQAGNVGSAEVGIRVRTGAPQLQIASPATGSGFNIAGTGGRVADLNPASGTCEAAFTVDCTEPGATVELIRVSTGLALSGGSATCEATGGLPAPYTGRATFSSVSLPSMEGELQVSARTEVDRLVGTSDPIGLFSDCQAPIIDVARPSCGATLRPTDDEDAATPGLQYRVEARNTNIPKPPVTLELRASDGTVVYGPVTSSTPTTGISTTFPGTLFTVGGAVTIHVCATDAAGNTGCQTSCSVNVLDIPTLRVTEPVAGTLLSTAADCDAARAGLQVRVRATTDAAAGSSASVQVGTASPAPAAVSGEAGPPRTVDVCVDAADGRDVPITVTVTDPVRGSASATVRVVIDTAPPPDAIDDLVVSEEDRRRGIARFAWTTVDDAGGGRLERYEARCAGEPITSEALWSAASPVVITTIPGTAGTLQSASVSGFRPGLVRHCVLRGADVAGALTPLPTTPPESYVAELLEQAITGTGQLGVSAAPIGDVNGDGFEDLLVGALDGHAYLYFGSAGGLRTTPDVVLSGPAAVGGFGRVLSSIGDFNGDGRPDFALSARALNTSSGAVWILFGRPSSTPWPAEVRLNETECGSPAAADVCLIGSQASAFFGWSVASAGDFDGDGFGDIAIGATGGVGRLYVILGGSFVSGTQYVFPDTSASPVNPDGFTLDAPAGTSAMGASSTTPGSFLGGDGRSDLVVSASGSATGSILGRVYAVAGRAYPSGSSGLVAISAADLTELASGSAGTFGSLVRSVGDHDGNGRVDVAVYNATSAGQVTVYLQGPTGFSAASSVLITNDVAGATGDLMGNTIGSGFDPFLGRIGDLDGDSMTDLLIGSTQRGTGAGSVDLFYGAGTAVGRGRATSDIVLQPAEAGAARVAAYVGDLNGDGFDDIVVGDPGYGSSAGRFLFVY